MQNLEDSILGEKSIIRRWRLFSIFNSQSTKNESILSSSKTKDKLKYIQVLNDKTKMYYA